MSQPRHDGSGTIHDPLEFARRGDVLGGQVESGRLSRLAGFLREGGESRVVRYRASGEAVGGKRYLHLEIQGEILLTCQRCLQELVSLQHIEATLMLVPQGAELPDEGLEDDSFDPVHVGREFDLVEAVEDELLLALPIAPMHEACRPPVESQGEGKASPFAVLQQLKARNDGE